MSLSILFGLMLLFYLLVFVGAVILATNVAFHTWRRLERKYPRNPAS